MTEGENFKKIEDIDNIPKRGKIRVETNIGLQFFNSPEEIEKFREDNPEVIITGIIKEER